MDTKETILDILQEMHADVDYEKEDKLVTDKILDSFDLVSLVTELSDEFDIQITAKDFIGFDPQAEDDYYQQWTYPVPTTYLFGVNLSF